MKPPARHLLTAAFAAALVAGCGGTERPPDDATPLLVTLGSQGAGADRLRSGDVAGARGLLEAELSGDPDRLDSLNDLGASYLLEGHSDAARRLLDEVVATGGPREQQDALLNLGELYSLQGYLDAAGAYLETARAVDRTRPEPWYALALLLDARGDRASADGALRAAIRLDQGGAARAALTFAFPEERLHLEALLLEQAGDRAGAAARWRELSQGRFATLADAAARRLAGD